MTSLVAIEGIDGVGKTKAQTYILNRLESEQRAHPGALLSCGITVIGGSQEVEALTHIAKTSTIMPPSRAAIMAAAHVEAEFWLGHLMASGYKIVVADRWEASFAAYQSIDLNVGFDEAYTLLGTFKNPLHRMMEYDVQTYVLDMDPYRLNYEPTDQIEKRGRQYMSKVRENYWQLAEQYDNIHIIEHAHTDEALERLYQQVRNNIADYLASIPPKPEPDITDNTDTEEF